MCEGTIPVDSDKFIMCVKGSAILIIDVFIILVDMLFKSTLVFALILLTTARISFESIGSLGPPGPLGLPGPLGPPGPVISLGHTWGYPFGSGEGRPWPAP